MTNSSTRVMRRPRGASATRAHAAAAMLSTVGLALLVAACASGSPSSPGAGGSPDAAGTASIPSAVAYSSCMRSHGVPNYPDPTSSGGIPKGSAQEFGVSSTQYHAAQTACAHLVPPGNASIQECEATGDCPQAVVQQALTVMRRYARCIRAHGVPNWPDPSIGSEGRPFFDVSAVGITLQFTHSSYFESKDNECERQVGGSAGVPVPMG